jgi:hypothetical protein
VGPKPSRISASSEVPVVVDCALTSTPLLCRSVVSAELFQNVGTSVEDSVVGLAFVSLAG